MENISGRDFNYATPVNIPHGENKLINLPYRGSVVPLELVEGENIFYVNNGLVGVRKTFENGKALINRLFGKGDFFGLSGSLRNDEVSTEIFSFGPATMDYKCIDSFKSRKSKEEYSDMLAEECIRERDESMIRLELLQRSSSTEERILGILGFYSGLVERDSYDGMFVFPFLEEEIGQMVGSSREYVSKSMAEMMRAGKVHVKRGLKKVPREVIEQYQIS